MVENENIVKVGKDEVNLDPKRMEFNETNLSKYLQEEAQWYNHYSQKLAEFEAYYKRAELTYESKYNAQFVAFKAEGGSDKQVEARCKCDIPLVELRNATILIKREVDKIRLHLRAWDKNHENAQSFGHNLRREMDKLQNDIRGSGSGFLEDILPEKSE